MSKYVEYIKELDAYCDKIYDRIRTNNIAANIKTHLGNSNLSDIKKIDRDSGIKYLADIDTRTLDYAYITLCLGSYFKSVGARLNPGAEMRIDMAERNFRNISSIMSEEDFLRKIDLKNGWMLNKDDLEFILATCPSYRNEMQEIFGQDLVNDKTFPNFDRIKIELGRLSQFARKICDRRKVETMTDEEIRTRYSEIFLKHYDVRISVYTEKLEQVGNLIDNSDVEITRETHPEYIQLSKELEKEKSLKEAEMEKIKSIDTEELRKKILSVMDNPERIYQTSKIIDDYKNKLGISDKNLGEIRRIIAHKEHELILKEYSAKNGLMSEVAEEIEKIKREIEMLKRVHEYEELKGKNINTYDEGLNYFNDLEKSVQMTSEEGWSEGIDEALNELLEKSESRLKF